MILTVIILLGLCLGSFINALVWRVYKQDEQKNKTKKAEYSIATGRSICVHCKHQLGAPDLIPVLSWISLLGKCRYCHKSISWQYPLVELVTCALFVLSYIYWPQDLLGLATVQFGVWLLLLTGLIALAVYDTKWMLLPNRIVFPLYVLAIVFVLIGSVNGEGVSLILSSAFGVLVGGGIFYILFQVSSGRWIGGGDVKLGFLIGGIVGSGIEALVMLFIASVIGCIFSLPMLLKRKTNSSVVVPFGPFLITACVIMVLVGNQIIDAYLNLVLL